MSIQKVLMWSVVPATAVLAVHLTSPVRGDPAGDAAQIDVVRGGMMYDDWSVFTGIDPPPGEHPLYPPAGIQTGAATFRCKECHGWDYKGVAGAYGSGSHFTSISGVFGSVMTAAELFDLIKFDTPPFGHGFGNYGLSDDDIDDIVDFLQYGVIDTDLYIDGAGQFIGVEVEGRHNYKQVGGQKTCISCHGADGSDHNFGTPLDPEYVKMYSGSNGVPKL